MVGNSTLVQPDGWIQYSSLMVGYSTAAYGGIQYSSLWWDTVQQPDGGIQYSSLMVETVHWYCLVVGYSTAA